MVNPPKLVLRLVSTEGAGRNNELGGGGRTTVALAEGDLLTMGYSGTEF